MSLKDLLNSPEYIELGRIQEEARDKFAKEAEEAWDSLDYDTQLRVFHAVISRLYKGEVKDKGTYRWILYDVFKFGPEAYGIGMDCGLMALHNAYVDIDDFEEMRKENIRLKKLTAEMQ